MGCTYTGTFPPFYLTNLSSQSANGSVQYKVGSLTIDRGEGGLETAKPSVLWLFVYLYEGSDRRAGSDIYFPAELSHCSIVWSRLQAVDCTPLSVFHKRSSSLVVFSC